MNAVYSQVNQGQLNYQITDRHAAARCLVSIIGDITYEAGCELLQRLWDDPPYNKAISAIWDVGACELPEFNDLMRTAKYINNHKNGRGPKYVAFVSPAFASSALARAFRGFDRVINLDLNFFGDHAAADDWLDKRTAEP